LKRHSVVWSPGVFAGSLCRWDARRLGPLHPPHLPGAGAAPLRPPPPLLHKPGGPGPVLPRFHARVMPATTQLPLPCAEAPDTCAADLLHSRMVWSGDPVCSFVNRGTSAPREQWHSWEPPSDAEGGRDGRRRRPGARAQLKQTLIPSRLPGAGGRGKSCIAQGVPGLHSLRGCRVPPGLGVPPLDK
jgi:hypothetical protein